jgi:hypothetical protein
MHNNEDIPCYLSFNYKDLIYNNFSMGFGPIFCSFDKETGKHF